MRSPEDQSFTHTLIEMFMVEANEAVARLLDSVDVPFLRRVAPRAGADRTPSGCGSSSHVAGHQLPKLLDRKAIQSLLDQVRGKPEAFAINLAVLKSLTRAEYSPEPVGHYALASEHYCHFTSPIRRYADLTIHRLLDAYFEAARRGTAASGRPQAKKVDLEDVPTLRRAGRARPAHQLHRAPRRRRRARAAAGQAPGAARRSTSAKSSSASSPASPTSASSCSSRPT